MEPLLRVTPDELSALQMENELLRYEVAHLRARLAAPRTGPKAGTGTSTGTGTGNGTRNGTAERDEAAQARRDLVWLLERLDAIPVAGPALRRRAGYRELRERYLGPDA